MSQDEMPFGRMRDPSIDFIKLQLLMVVNQLRTEVIAFQTERRITFNLLTMFLPSKKQLDNDTVFFVNSVNDRLAYLLETAKNLLRDPNDRENQEYQKFENLAKTMVERALIKKKFLGLRKKRL